MSCPDTNRLLESLTADAVDPEYFLERHGLRVTRVGTVSGGEGVWLQAADGSRSEVDVGGFDHFASSSDA